MADDLRRLPIYEDNGADVFRMNKTLKANDISEVPVCADGKTAVRLLNSRETESPPDSIIGDSALPHIPGLDILRRQIGLIAGPAMSRNHVVVDKFLRQVV